MHRLLDKDPATRTGVCSECGPVRIRQQGRATPGGAIRWRCVQGARAWNGAARRNAKRRPRSLCERCGFVPEHPCQMDTHHKDRNHGNDDPENLETLCANCHRLEHAPPT